MATQRAADRAASARQGGDRVITSNRRANHEYFIEDTIEAGMVLTGSEIKAIRDGKATIGEAYVRIENGELWLVGANIAQFANGGYANHQPDRPRKLLAHKRQIESFRDQIERKGLTIVPLRLVLRDGRAKLVIGVARGKKLYDKRAVAAERQSRRDVEQALNSRG
ncbi:MAG TPA: SsrA-binding protein SmpB [Thermomicrobiales bacterium]|jgi:SsrA-binding protein|nr:SsrA-binding protein SmpB [Thermomicrobiales bacterium]